MFRRYFRRSDCKNNSEIDIFCSYSDLKFFEKTFFSLLIVCVCSMAITSLFLVTVFVICYSNSILLFLFIFLLIWKERKRFLYLGAHTREKISFVHWMIAERTFVMLIDLTERKERDGISFLRSFVYRLLSK